MKGEVETIQVPHRFVEMAERRTRGIFSAAIHHPDALKVLMLSCYLQGLEDGYNAAEVRPHEDIR